MANVNAAELEADFLAMYRDIHERTMVDGIKCYDLYSAVKYVIQAGIPGAMVECGVWQGGCAMLMAQTCQRYGQPDRDIYLYDTYAGMTEPNEHDIRYTGEPAKAKWQEHQRQDHNDWCYAPLELVRENLAETNYDAARLHFVKGAVEKTIPATLPDRIAVLRLDTDFYDSTWHELVHLYPRLVPGGVLILDDYSCWQGQKRAVDQYFAQHDVHMKLTRQSTSATGVKAVPFALTREERQHGESLTHQDVDGSRRRESA